LVTVRPLVHGARSSPGGHVSEAEGLAFLCQNGVKKNLQQEVAKFLLEVLILALLNGAVQLIRLLYQVGAQRIVGLLGIPLTTSAQVAHHFQYIWQS
jgi:hypothetical protein